MAEFRRRRNQLSINAQVSPRHPSSESDDGEGPYEADLNTTNFVGAYVCFAPDLEEWMPRADYRVVGSAYLTGVIARMEKRKGNRKSANCDNDSNRIVNTNYYTYCQLLQMLRVFGAYGRGTIQRTIFSLRDDIEKGG
ncbi:hypothetical protein P3T76_001722 [Phytophthora citrophthora]|uniref:Uncharacterized protein n=1 Tax=Phytophthora citrophthora TaxID=4793 RepID=A0AAD9GW04_9STRA|nr:hypothetical protein P3T76_001722 [Phytophthora citrophthora]